MVDELTPAEKEELKDYLGYGSMLPDSKQNVHTFLHNVATADDTTKLGNLNNDEIGMAENPVRAYKFLSTFSNTVMKKQELANFFKERSEILTSTSLSRNATLIRLAVTQKKELADVSSIAPPKENKGWFKKKKQAQDEGPPI